MGFGNFGVPGAVKMRTGYSGGMEDDFSPDDYPSHAHLAGGGSSEWTTDDPIPGSGSGFAGAFSKNFGKSFLDMWKNRGSGSSGSDSGKNYFGPTSLGGGSIQPIGSGGKHFLFQYTHPQATIMPSAPSQPGLGEQLLGTAVGAGVSAAVPLMFGCDERIKVDMAPLESTEVNDELAEVAFFVKGLRECA